MPLPDSWRGWADPAGPMQGLGADGGLGLRLCVEQALRAPCTVGRPLAVLPLPAASFLSPEVSRLPLGARLGLSKVQPCTSREESTGTVRG